MSIASDIYLDDLDFPEDEEITFPEDDDYFDEDQDAEDREIERQSDYIMARDDPEEWAVEQAIAAAEDYIPERDD